MGTSPTFDEVRPAAEVDAEWLTAALHAAGVGRDAEVRAVTSAPIGTGQVGDNVRFELDWDGDPGDAPDSVVGKFPSTDPESRQAGVMTRTYLREAGFYGDLQPSVDIRTPRLFHVGWAPDDDHAFTILMEDLSGSAQGDQVRGCTVDQARTAVHEVVGLHAPTWGWMARAAGGEVPTYEWLDTPGGDTEAMVSMLLGTMFPAFAERYEGRLSAEDLALAGEAVAAHAALRAAGAEWAERLGAWCVVHGDYRLDNLLFGTGPDAPPVCVVDWQTAAVGTGPADVAYFLASALPSDVRADVERGLVGEYAAGLRAAGVDLADEDVWDGYVLGAASCLIMAVFASQAVGRTERGDEMFAVMAEGSIAQMRHLGLLGRL